MSASPEPARNISPSLADLCAVQNEKGTQPGSFVSSEMAAFVEHRLIPDLQKLYIKDNGAEGYQKMCQELARKLQLPKERWHMVQIPVTLSFDNATIHPWAIQNIMAPRLSQDELQQRREELFLNIFEGIQLPEQVEPPLGPNPNKRPAAESANLSDLAAHQQNLAKLRQQRLLHDRLNARIQQYIQQNGCDPWLQYMYHQAQHEVGVMTIIPEQVPPLAPCSGDIHMPVEHFVGTIKREVHRQLKAFDISNPALSKGITLFEAIESAVASKGRGVAARKHVAGSLRKLPHLLRILAAPAGQELTINYDFGHGPKDYTVRGTAGGYCPDLRWT